MGTTIGWPVALATAFAVQVGVGTGSGDPVRHRFQVPPVNSQGVQSLSDFRGKPVLIHFWGRSSPSCVEKAVPASLVLQRERGGDLQVLFVECQGDRDAAEAFAWRRKWMNTAALWTTELPPGLEGEGLPRFVLLDSEGRVLLSGDPLELKRQINQAIAAEVQRRRQPPRGTPAKLEKAWARFIKGEVGEALQACAEISAADSTLAAAGEALRAEMIARTEVRIAQGRWLAENGYGEAIQVLTELMGPVKECPPLRAQLSAAMDRLLQTSGLEIRATEEFTTLMKRIRDKALEESSVEALNRFVQEHGSTRAGQRAAHLVALARISG